MPIRTILTQKIMTTDICPTGTRFSGGIYIFGPLGFYPSKYRQSSVIAKGGSISGRSERSLHLNSKCAIVRKYFPCNPFDDI